jgi:hypothetical protein
LRLDAQPDECRVLPIDGASDVAERGDRHGRQRGDADR